MGGRNCSLRASLLAAALSAVSLLVLITMVLSVLSASGVLRGLSVCSTCGASPGEQRGLVASVCRGAHGGLRLTPPGLHRQMGREESGVQSTMVCTLGSPQSVCDHKLCCEEALVVPVLISLCCESVVATRCPSACKLVSESNSTSSILSFDHMTCTNNDMVANAE